jgi:hypothetical protein
VDFPLAPFGPQKKSPGGRRGFYLLAHWEGVRLQGRTRSGEPEARPDVRVCSSVATNRSERILVRAISGEYRSSAKLMWLFSQAL